MGEKKKLVLVVDDDAINRRILCNILAEDYNTLQAENGREALEVLERHWEDVCAILLDIVMPEMDGYAFLQIQQANEHMRGIPVLVTSYMEQEEAELKALRFGAADFVSKPYRPSVIRHRLKNVINLKETVALVRTIERDSLTGLYNKDSFYELAAQELSANPDTDYDLVAVDINCFRVFNEIYGSGEGDHLLKFIAGLLRNISGVRRGLCARIDGDRFMMLLPRAERLAAKLPEELQEKLHGFHMKARMKAKIAIRFGIYMVSDRTISLRGMCDRAFLAAESIKGRYGILSAEYDDAIRKKLLDETEIANDMAGAVRNQQFVVYLQPKYDIYTEKIAGAEALVRWEHHTRGFMGPDEFIPLFEKNGFVTELDTFVWEETCSIIRSWLDSGGKYVPVSVNVSRPDIYDPDLPVKLLDIVHRHGLEPKHLHLEITETAYTQNPQQLIEVVKQLKSLGFLIEMDDFGSGYSSLNMLSELPIDILKLDMKFIQNEGKAGRRNILSFVIGLAKWLDLLVIAEGVETEQQLNMLRNMDCNMVQGFYFSRPLPVDRFTRLLQESETVSIEPNAKPMDIGKADVRVIAAKNSEIALIVDDLELNRLVLESMFTKYYTIATADNGAAAYSFLLEHKGEVAVVMLDLVMPIMDGFQVLQKIKESPDLQDIPVVITSQASQESEIKVLEMGASDYITKPYNPDVVIRRVQNAIAGNKLRVLEKRKQNTVKM